MTPAAFDAEIAAGVRWATPGGEASLKAARVAGNWAWAAEILHSEASLNDSCGNHRAADLQFTLADAAAYLHAKEQS